MVEVRKKRKLNVGSGGVEFDSSWFSCDKKILDITKYGEWRSLLTFAKVTNIFAEHVWEHLTPTEAFEANKNCFEFLKKGGVLRLAVPDGYFPDKQYIDYVKPNGYGIGADDHKVLYNYKTLIKSLEVVGFKVDLLEYWDEEGVFHFKEWSDESGRVQRSRRYDKRNNDDVLNYTSLIVDAKKQ